MNKKVSKENFSGACGRGIITHEKFSKAEGHVWVKFKLYLEN